LRSFLRHSRLAQAIVISCFEQGADFRHTPICDGLQASDARKTIVAARPAGFGEFGGGAVRVAFDPIGGGEIGVSCRPETSALPRRFFMAGTMPLDRLIDFANFNCAAAPPPRALQ
jgi:hypothetical protein